MRRVSAHALSQRSRVRYFVGMTTPIAHIDLDPAALASLDALAQALGVDRKTALEQALDGHLETVRWQRAHISEGLAQADAGDFVDEPEWRAKGLT